MEDLTFDLDCGELVPGHHFVATGFARRGSAADRLHSDYVRSTFGLDTDDPVFALEYRLVAVEPVRGSAIEERPLREVTVEAGFTELDEAGNALLTADSSAGAIGFPADAPAGGELGPWPVRPGTRSVVVALALPRGVAPHGRPVGDLRLDLAGGTATWTQR